MRVPIQNKMKNYIFLQTCLKGNKYSYHALKRDTTLRILVRDFPRGANYVTAS